MSAMKEAMDNDEERMAILGARIISAEKKGIEAVDTAKIHRAGENSVLATFSTNVSNVLSLAIKDYIEWCSARVVDVTVQMNTDFDTTSLSAQDLTAFVSAWQNGALSREQLHKNLQRGEIIDSDLTLDDMLNEMERE